MVGIDEAAQEIGAGGPRGVVEVDSAEEAVFGGFGEEEAGEGPLDDGEDGDEEEAGDERDLPGLPGVGALPEEIEGDGGHDDEDGECGRDHVGDGIVDGAEFWLRGKEREDEDLGDGEECVDRGGGGCGPAVARCLREHGKDEGKSDAHCDVRAGGMEVDVPGVLEEEEHLAADDEAADIEEDALEGFEGVLVGVCLVGCGAVHGGDGEEEDADGDGSEAEDEEGVGRADDFYVEAVGGVPPVVERGGGDHGDAAPCGDERA